MKRRKIKKRYHKSKNVFILVALIIVTIITTAFFSSFFIRINAKETVTLKEYTIPTRNSVPNGITAGPDGNVWFTEIGGNKIGRITPNGRITEFQLTISSPDTTPQPYNITVGPDDNLWFTEFEENKIGKITPSGTVTEFLIPTDNSAPFHITSGPDGNLWFTEANESKIGRITPNGTITEFPVQITGNLVDITSGPDGNLWFTESAKNIGRITPAGAFTEFPLTSYDNLPGNITAGPDGNVWFTEAVVTDVAVNKIGRVTPDGTITEFSLPVGSNDTRIADITAGPDGNLWFIRNGLNETDESKIGRITPNGTITEFPFSIRSSIGSIAKGPDDSVWFTESSVNKIGRLTLSPDRGPDRDFELLSPFNNGVTWTVSSGYFNNRNQSSSGCHIGLGPDHCRNQLFGLDMIPDQQSDTDILAPGNGIVAFRGKLEDEDCIGLRITLDNGLNLNVCHFASFNVNQGERVVRGKVLGIRSTPHVHLSLDDRYRIGTLCPKDRCYLPVPFDGQHTIEGISYDPNPNGETVLLPYSLCDERKVDCQFEVDFQQYRGTTGTSTNVAIP